MWSLACILVELFTGRTSLLIARTRSTCTVSLLRGYPLFPGENEQEQLSLIIEVIGLPPSSVLEQGTRRKLFFGSSLLCSRSDAWHLLHCNVDSRGLPRHVLKKSSDVRRPASRSLAKMLPTTDNDFLDFIQRCFEFVAVAGDRLCSTLVSLIQMGSRETSQSTRRLTTSVDERHSTETIVQVTRYATQTSSEERRAHHSAH